MTKAKNPVVSVPASELTRAEIQWLMAYREMDQEAKDSHLRFAESTARAHPMRGATIPPRAPGLHLAAAFGKAVAG